MRSRFGRYLISASLTVLCALPALHAKSPAPLAVNLELKDVSPRIFSPQEPATAVNRVTFTFDNPDDIEFSVRIFDVTGKLVRSTIARDSDTKMYWDGLDSGGAPVNAGIYIYQVDVDGKLITGTIIVAR